MGIGLLVVVALVLGYFLRHILGGMVGLYRVVPVNEAHIRILGNKKDIFSTREKRSSYWVVPFITKLNKLPLSNIAIPVNDIKLNDKEMAKFACDMMCFVNIDDVSLAGERLILTPISSQVGFDVQALAEDLRAILESIGRTSTTKHSILDVYMNRQSLDAAITKEVEMVFPKWGIKLVNLELKDLKDVPGSSIIQDIERKVAAEISRDATIRTATTNREAEIAKAEAEEAFRKRQIEKDKNVAIAQQEAQIMVQEKTAEANIKAVEAARKLEVGTAEIRKQIVEQDAQAAKIKTEQEAQAQKIKFEVEAEGKAKEITSVGQATADMVKAKLVAEAQGTDELAKALKQFDQTAISVKVLDIQKEILIAKFDALASIAGKADIKWIMSGENAGNFFGLNLDAAGGANLDQFCKEAGINLPMIKSLLPNKENK
ncbi:MAG TPA: SPFH domain-containing protein [Candidatus Obscuribacterales bacterium]